MYNFNTIENLFKQTKENDFNPYDNPKKYQAKCKHMWDNDTDAIYVDHRGKRICAICKKEF